MSDKGPTPHCFAPGMHTHNPYKPGTKEHKEYSKWFEEKTRQYCIENGIKKYYAIREIGVNSLEEK